MERLLQVSIVNVVATTDLAQHVNLNRTAAEEGFQYDEAVYRCAYLKDSKTFGKVSIFASGKMISMGTKSFKAAKHDLNHAHRKLVDLRLIEPTRIRIILQNIVATAAIGDAVDFQKLTKLPNVMYEPDQFPGAIYYAKELEGASILVFANGKVVLAGLKNERLLELGKQVIRNLALLATR